MEKIRPLVFCPMTVILVAALLMAPWGLAVPNAVCIQGVLTDTGGNPLTGTRLFGVQYYDAEDGGNPLGGEINGSVDVNASGAWSIVLTPPTAVIGATGEVWYALGIDSTSSPDGSLDPGDMFGGRVRVGSVYFAQRAGDADSLAGANPSSFSTDTELTNGLAAKADVVHWHDERYYTESEVDASLAGKADSVHTHDGRYYQESEVDSALADKADTSDLVFERTWQVVSSANTGLDFVVGSTFLNDTGNSSQDSRFFFDKGNAAFRAGKATGSSWDSSNVGDCSFASGRDTEASGNYSTVGGGRGNEARADYASIAGGGPRDQNLYGDANIVFDKYGTIGGGGTNRAGSEDADTTNAMYATVCGGELNSATGDSSTVGGGQLNGAGGTYATVPGGSYNEAAGESSLAAGRYAEARHKGSFVWSDSSNSECISAHDDQFKVRAGGGVFIEDNGGSHGLYPPVLSVNSTSSDGVALYALQDSSDATLVVGNDGTGDLIKGFNNGDLRFAVSQNGDIYADGTLHSPAADFAEYLPKRDPVEPLEAGDVVGLFPDGLSKRTAGAQRILVITTKPLILGNTRDGGAPVDHAAVVMLGQAPVKVSGPVRAGDCLVAAGDNGTAVAVNPAALPVADYARVVGTALEASNQGGIHTLRASVGLGMDDLWVRAIQVRDARVTALERELTELKAAVGTLLAEAH